MSQSLALHNRIHVPEMGEIVTPESYKAAITGDYGRAKLREVFSSVARSTANVVLGRDFEILMLLSAIISGENVMLFGDSGEGKTFLADTLMKHFITEGEYSCSIFSTQFFEDMAVEPVLGAVPLDVMMSGGTRRDTIDRLPTANFALLDEFGKGPSAVATALMSILNEGRFFNGTHYERSPLITAIAMTNEDDFDVIGLAQRFLVKMVIEPSNSATRIALMMRQAESHKKFYAPDPSAKIDMRQLYFAMIVAGKVDVPLEVVTMIVNFTEIMNQNGLVVNTRQLVNIVNFLKAYIWLKTGQKSVGFFNLEPVPYLLSPLPSNLPMVKALWKDYSKTIAPVVTGDPIGDVIEQFSIV